MIVVKMMGNLGNQMFIYAMARTMQLQYGENVLFDLSGLKRYYYSASYKLDEYAIPKDGISYDMKRISYLKRKQFQIRAFCFQLQQYINRKLRKSRIMSDKACMRWFRKGCFFNFNRTYLKYPVSKKKDKFVYGYFQAVQYWKEYEETIKKELKVAVPINEKDMDMYNSITSCNAVGVSIRAINEHGVSFVDYDFYYRGMEEIAKKLENPVFYVFSDDLEYVKNNLKFPYPVIYVEPSDSNQGMRLLYSCKHFVIANSTFSWWGAYLCDNEDKIIVMPTPWDKMGVYREDIYFDNAIRLECSFVDYKFDLDQVIHEKYAH